MDTNIEACEILSAETSGYIVAPAGCGKTETIVKAVSNSSDKRFLILTHTNAGVSALKKRFAKNSVSKSKYNIQTISGWALSWVSKYPKLSKYNGNLPLPDDKDWSDLYVGAKLLVSQNFVKNVIINSYTDIIVDEYQDCSQEMHELITQLKKTLFCKVLGDPLQGIFDFKAKIVDWDIVEKTFQKLSGNLKTPHRWINAGNKELGDWLISSRKDFSQNKIPSFHHTPVTYEDIESKNLTSRLQTVCRSKKGSLCVIGPKHGNFPKNLPSALANIHIKWIEPITLPTTKKFITNILKGKSSKEKSVPALNFISDVFTGLGAHKSFITNCLEGTIKRQPKDVSKSKIYTRHKNGYSHELFIDLIDFIQTKGIHVKKYESLTFLEKVLKKNIETSTPLLETYANEIAKKKYFDSRRPNRCLGTTLLLKGLEFDHVVIFYKKGDTGWSNPKDLYVALTRGSKSAHIIFY